MKTMFTILGISTAALMTASPSNASTIYLNDTNISVSVGANTGAGTSNNTFAGGATIDKVIDAASADATDDHNQATHIWYSFNDPNDGLELIFDLGVSYDITELHFWNYTGEFYDVDKVSFSFFDSLDSLIGTTTIMPALGAPSGIVAEDISLVSPLNTRKVVAFLTGSNGQIDFQNIGFTANLSDPNLDPSPSAVPLPAGMPLLLGGLFALGYLKRRKLRPSE